MLCGIFFTEDEINKIITVVDCIDADIGSLWNRQEIWEQNNEIKVLLNCLSKDIGFLRKKLGG